jgi:LPS export ABC transporter protein LptC/lipopolysaccharide transport protein LptA
LAAAAAVLLSATALWVLIGTLWLSPVKGPTAPAAPAADGGSMVIEGIQQTAARDGVTEWILNARSGRFLATEKKFLLTEPHVTFFHTDGQRFFLSARNGVVATDSHDMEAEGEVLIWNERYRIRTEQIRYAHAERTITSDRPVAITSDRGEMTAAAGSVDVKANRVRLEGDVRAEIPAEPGGGDRGAVRVSSDRLLVDLNADAAEFSGNARLTEKNSLTTAETITVYAVPRPEGARSAAADPDQVAVERVVARGGVVIRTEESTAAADEALYEPATETLTLTGRQATLQSPSASLGGRRIVVSMRTHQLSAEGGAEGRVAVVLRPSPRPQRP